MIPTINVTIDGVQYKAQPEVAASVVAELYTSYLNPFYDVINTNPNAITAAQLTAMQNSINGLNALAATGGISYQMAQAMDQLYATLKTAGMQPSTTPITLPQLNAWRNLAFSSDTVIAALDNAKYAGGVGNRTLQALTEIVYVNTGNQVLSDSLEKLEQALSSTTDVLSTLNDLQQLHNQITAVDKESFSSYVDQVTGIADRLKTRLQSKSTMTLLTALTVDGVGLRNTMILTRTLFSPSQLGDPSLYLKQIQSLASAHFGPITPQLAPELVNLLANSGVYPSAVVQFLQLRDKIRLEISALYNLTPSAQRNDPQTLLGRLRVVFNGMEAAINSVPPGQGMMQLPLAVKAWILDNYSNIPNAATGASGAIQNALNNAITAGQNLNDQQKEETRRYLFVFEEFYKSASSILTKITQLVEKMAQGINK